MTRHKSLSIVRSWIGVAAALLVLASTAWLLAEYVHALRVTPRETALVNELKEKARTDTGVQKVLLPEFDRQREALARRHRAYDRGGLLLLVSLGLFLAWAKWLRPERGGWVGVPRWLPKVVSAGPRGKLAASAPTSPRAGGARRSPASVVSRPPAAKSQRQAPATLGGAPTEIRIGAGTCGVAAGALEVKKALEQAVASLGCDTIVKPVGCIGACHEEPLVEVVAEGRRVSYGRVTPQEARAIVRAHLRPRGIVRMVSSGLGEARALLVDDSAWVPISDRTVDVLTRSAGQVRIALENCGLVDPGSLDDYRRQDGYRGFERCLGHLTPGEVIETVGAAGLRERGGPGLGVASAWGAVRDGSGAARQIVCLSDNVEPRVFIDRTILEGDPFRVIEGLSIGAYAAGASEAVIHLGRSDSVTVDRIRAAAAIAEANGLLGRRILGSSFDLSVQVRAEAGQPGDTGATTVVHHVETLAALPWILRRGAEAFAALGTARSTGTKVFSLGGSITRAGFIEVPLGTSVREIVEGAGGGIEDGRAFKAIMVGGRAGVCIPAQAAGTPIDYETLAGSEAALGSGGLVVLDESECAVEIARRYLRAVANQKSTGAGSRDAVRRMIEIVERIRDGRGTEDDIAKLESFGRDHAAAAPDGSPAAFPDTAWTTIRYFRDEYEAHVRDRRCPAAACKPLIHYRVLPSSCNGCTLCAQACRTGAIEARPYLRHEVNDDRCKRCGMCRASCPEHAIEVA